MSIVHPPPSRAVRRPPLWTLGALALVLGLGACSGGGTGGSMSGATSPTTEAAAAADETGGAVGPIQAVEGPVAGGEPPSDTIDCGAGGVVSVAGPAPIEAITRRAAELFLAPCPAVQFTIDRTTEELGFSLLCGGLADVVGAARAPTDDELERCAAAGIELVSLPLADEALVVVTGRANTGLGCLAFADLYALLGPESLGFRTWSDAAGLAQALGSEGVEYPEEPLEIFGPADGDADRLAFEEIVLAPTAEQQDIEPTVRSDLIGGRDVSELVEVVSGSERGLGWMPFDLAAANADTLTVVPLRRDASHDCVSATVATVADGSYPASRRLTLWLPLTPDGTVRSFIEFLYGETYPVAVGSANGSTGYLTLPESERAAALAAWP